MLAGAWAVPPPSRAPSVPAGPSGDGDGDLGAGASASKGPPKVDRITVVPRGQAGAHAWSARHLHPQASSPAHGCGLPGPGIQPATSSLIKGAGAALAQGLSCGRWLCLAWSAVYFRTAVTREDAPQRGSGPCSQAQGAGPAADAKTAPHPRPPAPAPAWAPKAASETKSHKGAQGG